jgi:hypothetical protein
MLFVSDYMKAIDFVALAALTKYETVINLKTIKSLGLTVPAVVSARADAVVE